MPTFKGTFPTPLRQSLLAWVAATLAGCSATAPSGYGLLEGQNSAVLAQQQIEAAEQSTQPNTAQTYLDLIGQMQQAGQWYASLAHADAFEQQYGARPQSDLMRADALRNTGQGQAAKVLYESLLTTTVAAQAWRGLGLLYANAGQYALAITQFEQARKLSPINASVLSDIAYAQMLSGNLAAARVPIWQASQLAPDDARIQLNLALYLMAQGEHRQAHALLQRLGQAQRKAGSTPIDIPRATAQLERQLQQVQEAIYRHQTQRAAAPTTASAQHAY